MDIESEPVQSVPQSISQPIFAPVAKGQGSNYLGQDPIAFFADPRFQQKWFWCYAFEEH